MIAIHDDQTFKTSMLLVLILCKILNPSSMATCQSNNVALQKHPTPAIIHIMIDQPDQQASQILLIGQYACPCDVRIDEQFYITIQLLIKMRDIFILLK